MCLRRAPEKYIAGVKAPAGAALDGAALRHKIAKQWQETCAPVYSQNESTEVVSSLTLQRCAYPGPIQLILYHLYYLLKYVTISTCSKLYFYMQEPLPT
jgi:hypothetical protein